MSDISPVYRPAVLKLLSITNALETFPRHLGLWDRNTLLIRWVKEWPPSKSSRSRAETQKQVRSPKVREYCIDYSMSQLSCFPDQVSDLDSSGSDKWLYVDPEYPETFES